MNYNIDLSLSDKRPQSDRITSTRFYISQPINLLRLTLFYRHRLDQNKALVYRWLEFQTEENAEVGLPEKFLFVAKVLCFVVVVWMCLHLLKVWQWHVPGPTTSLLCLFNKECSHQLRTPHSLSQLLMEIKKVSVFLLEVYLQSLQGQCRLGLIIQFHFQQTKNGEFRLVSDQVGLGLFPCWALLLFGSLPALRFILLTEEMFSQSGV